MESLTAKIVALHEALDGSGLSHAFGGALALAFCTLEPRGTQDIDVNVFVGPDRVDELLGSLPAAITATTASRSALARDAQARLWWDDTPVDVFLSNHPFHAHAEANRRHVPFASVDRLPVLACSDLAVFKAFFARPKDVVDIATMVAAGTVDLDALAESVDGLLGSGDDRAEFFGRVGVAARQIRSP